MRVGDDSAAYAVNWRVVLVADALVGVAVAVAGVAAFFFWNIAVGAAVLGVGVVYVALVGRPGPTMVPPSARRRAGA